MKRLSRNLYYETNWPSVIAALPLPICHAWYDLWALESICCCFLGNWTILIQSRPQNNQIWSPQQSTMLGKSVCVSSPFPCYLHSRGVLPHITMHQHHACPVRGCPWNQKRGVGGGWRGINFWKWDNLGLCHVMSFAPIELSDYQSGQWSRCLRSPKVLQSLLIHNIL